MSTAHAMARQARITGVLGELSPSSPLAQLGMVTLFGPDAASFLHSQVSNQVLALAVGQGNESALLTRTGHLRALCSVHRLATDRLLLLTQASQGAFVAETLANSVFSDQVEVAHLTAPWHWVAVQGPHSAAPVGTWLGIDAKAMAECGVMPHPSVPEGVIIRRSLTGDQGFLVGCPGQLPNLDALIRLAQAHDLLVLTPSQVDQVLEPLRIETGWLRVGPDTARKVLLPETGLEGRCVSYTKGCYLGQEVVARVRTYGSLPRALRALVVQTGRKGPQATLDTLPAPGAEVVAADGTPIGWYASRCLSPTLGAPMVLAYLNKTHRNPGQKLVIWSERGPLTAVVHLLPIYHAPDRITRATALYDRAIRTFAKGDTEAALQLLGECLRENPSFADGYEAIGVMLGREGRFFEAIDFFKRLESVAPHEPMVDTNLSLYYMKLGDTTTAEHHKAAAVAKSLAKGRNATTSAGEIAAQQQQARLGDAQRKKNTFQQVLAFDDVDPIALFGMGRACAVLGEWEAAATHLAKASQVNPNNSAIYLEHGKALQQLGRNQQALAVYQQGLQVASKRGDLAPLHEMEHRVLLLTANAP